MLAPDRAGAGEQLGVDGPTPASGLQEKSTPTTAIFEHGSLGSSAVSLTTTVYLMNSKSSVSWWTSKPVERSVSGDWRRPCA